MNKTCVKCNGTGVEEYYDHGYAEHGLDAIEPIRCSDCDGFGYITELTNEKEIQNNRHINGTET